MHFLWPILISLTAILAAAIHDKPVRYHDFKSMVFPQGTVTCNVESTDTGLMEDVKLSVKEIWRNINDLNNKETCTHKGLCTIKFWPSGHKWVEVDYQRSHNPLKLSYRAARAYQPVSDFHEWIEPDTHIGSLGV